jgi:hypothetical protein
VEKSTEGGALCSVLVTKYYSGDQMEKDEMDGYVAHMGERRGAHEVLVERHKGGRPRGRWEDSIRMDLQKVGWGGRTDQIEVAQDRDVWRTPVNAVVNVWVPQNVGNFLISLGPVCFSRRTVPWGEGMQGDIPDTS